MAKVIFLLLLLSPLLLAFQKSDLEKALQLMKQYPLIDGHNDLPYQLYGQHQNQFYDIDLTENQPTFHTDIPRLREGHVSGQFWSVYVGCKTEYSDWSDDVMRTIEQIDVTKRMISLYPEHFELALTAQDIKDSFSRGKIASLMGMEGGHSIDSSLATLRMMYDLGARYMTLTHNCHTSWADTASQDPEHNGLTPFGIKLVHEMNRLGMLVDLSHVSVRVMEDALAATHSPIIFSHSSAYSICDHVRNVPDHVLRLTQENGGVVMVTFVPSFVCCGGACNLTHVADHVEHVVSIAGIDHVGIGGDYDGVDSLPVGLEDVSKYPYLIAELISRGFSDEDVGKLLGGNLIRVLEANEVIAKQLQASKLPEDAVERGPRTCPE